MIDSNLLIAARHEIAHALAFVHHEVEFVSVTLDSHGGGEVHIDPRRASHDEIGNINMAGPAVEYLHRLSQPGADRDRLLADMVDGWRMLLDIELADEGVMATDEAGAASVGMLAHGFAWAVGFVHANDELIDGLAHLLIDSDGYLGNDALWDFAEVIEFPDSDVVEEIYSGLESHTETIRIIHEHLASVTAD